MTKQEFKELRSSKKITQQKLSDLLGFGQSTVSKWENGKVEPDAPTVFKLSEILGCSVEEILACFCGEVKEDIMEKEKAPTNEEKKITFAELETAATPLVELLRKKGNPHMTVHVTDWSITLTKDIMGVPMPYDD